MKGSKPRRTFSLDEIATVYDDLSFWASRFGRLLIDNLPIVREGRVLDVGCGTGFPLFEIAHMFGAGCRAVGVDIWPAALGRAAVKLRTYGLPNVGLVQGDAAALPLPSGIFDLVVSNLGVNNFADPLGVVAECFRVSRPGGRFVLTTNIEGHMGEFYAVFRDVLAELGRSRYLDRLRANERHRGTDESLRAMVESVGFRVARTVQDSFVMRYADGTALMNQPLTIFGFLDGWHGVVPPEDRALVFDTIERTLNDLAARDGEIRMSVPMLYLEAVHPARSASSTA